MSIDCLLLSPFFSFFSIILIQALISSDQKQVLVGSEWPIAMLVALHISLSCTLVSFCWEGQSPICRFSVKTNVRGFLVIPVMTTFYCDDENQLLSLLFAGKVR